jgi:hypothetical protein
MCGPSDDPDRQTAVTTSYRHLIVQFQRLASRYLTNEFEFRLNAISVDVNDIYSAYDARAELDALLPEIEDAIEFIDDAQSAGNINARIVDSAIIDALAEIETTNSDAASLVRMCREINSSHAHGNILATVLLMRTVLNHVPPVFGFDTFVQVATNSGKSLRDSFDHLESGLRKVADFHAHRQIAASEFYPSAAQVEPYKPQFELLLQQVIARLASSAKTDAGTS